MNDLVHTKKVFENTKVIKIGEYPYPISPLSGVNPINPELLNEIVQAAEKQSIIKEADFMVTFETAGAQLAAVFGQKFNLPYVIARKKKLDLPGEISFKVITNFDEKTFYIYGDVVGRKILIVDDVIASGATAKNAALALKDAGAKVIALFAVAAKSNTVGRRYEDNLSELELPLISLIKIKIEDGRVEVI